MSDFCVLLGLIFVLGTIWVQIVFCGCLFGLKVCVISGDLAIFILFNAILRRAVLYPAELREHMEIYVLILAPNVIKCNILQEMYFDNFLQIWGQFFILVICNNGKSAVITRVLRGIIFVRAFLRRRSLYPAELRLHMKIFAKF